MLLQRAHEDTSAAVGGTASSSLFQNTDCTLCLLAALSLAVHVSVCTRVQLSRALFRRGSPALAIRQSCDREPKSHGFL